MKRFTQLTALFALTTLSLISCDKDDDNEYNPNPAPVQSTVFSLAGDSGAVAGKLSEFRLLLGDQLNTAPNATGGRREVNWDGVPATLTNNNTFPIDFFNNKDAAGPNARKRGMEYAANGTQFRLDSSGFSEIDASYATQFLPFSKKKLLIAAGTTVSDIIFKVPGTATDASVKGFGVIFSDVDVANSTSIEFFNGAKSLGLFNAPASAGDGKFSLLGVHFPTEKITRLKINAGNGLLAPGVKDITNGGTKDLVAYDDFIYSEPVAQ